MLNQQIDYASLVEQALLRVVHDVLDGDDSVHLVMEYVEGRTSFIRREPVGVIGQIAPFTGSAAEYGTYYRDAAGLALQHLANRIERSEPDGLCFAAFQHA